MLTASRASRWLVGILLVSGFLLFPKFGAQYHIQLLIGFFSYSIAVLGLNLLFGYTGLLSFGHALFWAVGAYLAAFLTTKFSVMYMEVILASAVVGSALLAVVLGFICARYEKIFFAMLTLAFGMLVYSFLMQFYYITRGDQGMGVLRPYLLGIRFTQMPLMKFLTQVYYYYAFAVFILAVWVMWRIVSSPFGLSIRAVKNNPEKAKYLGLNIKKYRWYSFIISGVYTAIGGAMYAPVAGHVVPEAANWTHSGNLVFMILIGGAGNFWGPMIGTGIFIYLQDFVKSITLYWRFIFGFLLAFVIITAPEGVAGVITKLANKFIRRTKYDA